MASATETALAGLKTTLDGISGPTVEREIDTPEDVPSGGLIVLRDGDPGEPEETLSPHTYHYEHVTEVELYVQEDPSTRDGSWDDVAAQVGSAIASDPTLGGAVDGTRVDRPDDITTEAPEGAAGAKSGTIPVTLYYSTTTPLQ